MRNQEWKIELQEKVHTWMKKANDYQKTKVQSECCLVFAWFCQFQPDIAYKSVAYKESL